MFGVFSSYYWGFLNDCHVFLQTLSPAPKPSLSYGYFYLFLPSSPMDDFQNVILNTLKVWRMFNVNHVYILKGKDSRLL